MTWWLVYAVLILIVVFVLIRFSRLSGLEEETPTRTCPVCGSKLEEGEQLFADEIRKNEKESELKIKGCPHCYKKD